MLNNQIKQDIQANAKDRIRNGKLETETFLNYFTQSRKEVRRNPQTQNMKTCFDLLSSIFVFPSFLKLIVGFDIAYDMKPYIY